MSKRSGTVANQCSLMNYDEDQVIDCGEWEYLTVLNIKYIRIFRIASLSFLSKSKLTQEIPKIVEISKKLKHNLKKFKNNKSPL